MRKLVAKLCLTIAVLLGSAGLGASADFQKGAAAYQIGDYATALHEWTPLAKQGDAVAQYILGQMYRKGKGALKNYETAAMWYSLAAEQGYAKAQGNLGAMYVFGAGVPKDYLYAHMWGNIASTNGNKLGAKVRDIAVTKMNPADLSAAKKLARECVRKKYKGC
jgi:TPR repeat protein